MALGAWSLHFGVIGYVLESKTRDEPYSALALSKTLERYAEESRGRFPTPAFCHGIWSKQRQTPMS